VIVALGLTSCINDSVLEPETHSVGVVFGVTLENVNSYRGSRVSGSDTNNWTNQYDSDYGSGLDVYLKTIDVLVYDANTNEYIGRLDRSSLVERESSETGVHKFVSSFDINRELKAGDKFKFVVLLNSVSLSGTDITSTNAKVVWCDADGKRQLDAIPMWGVGVVEVPDDFDNSLSIGNIYVLRSVAKVEIKLSDDIKDDNQLQQAVVSIQSSELYQAPASFVNAATVGELTHVADTFNPCKDANQLIKDAAYSADNNIISIYLPEYSNTATGAVAATITLVINDIEYAGAVHFQDYSDGKPVESTDFDIVRNHLYQYVITGVAKSGLKFKTKIKDMELGGEYEYEY
jgi:hypothetical protein